MIAKNKSELTAVSAKLDSDLVYEVFKKMQRDKKQNKKITWRIIWEEGMKQYLKENK